MAESGQGRTGGIKGRAIAGVITLAGAPARRRWLSWWPHLANMLAANLARDWLLEVDRRRLFLWLPVAWGCGIIAYFAAETEPSPWASGLPMLAGLVLATLGRKRLLTLVAALAFAAFFAGFLSATLRTRLIAAPILAAPVFVSVDGRIETIDRTVYGGRMVVRVFDVSPAIERMPERLRVTFRGQNTLESGDGVRFKARLTPPQPAAVPGGFDFQREAFFQRLGAVGFATGEVSVVPALPDAPLRSRIVAAVDRGRNALTDRIIAVIGGSTGAISAALITGKRGQIAEADNESWRAAGIYHIVSISGLHMVLAAGLFFWAARLAFGLVPGLSARHPTKKWAALVAMLGACAYDVFSGSEVATERSLIMTLVMFGAVLCDRPALAMRNLAISGLIIMAIKPETVLGPSFQMSFGAVAGLVAYGEIERHWRQAHPGPTDHEPGWRRRLARIVLASVLTSLIAGLATAPFQAYHFHRLNPYGILGNALAIPICSFVVMPAALLGVVLYPLGLDAPVWWIMGQGIARIQDFAHWVAALSGSVAMVPRFSASTLALMAFGLLLTTLMTTVVFRIAGLTITLAATLLPEAPRPHLILDATGRTAMVRTASGALSLLGPQRPAFAIQQWLAGDSDNRPPRAASLGHATACDPLGCTATLADGRTVALVLAPQAFAEDCERASIIVTPLKAPDFCWSGPDIYDRDYFRAYGATYITPSASGDRLETTRNARMDRPWHPSIPATPQLVSVPAAAPQARPTEPLPPAWDPQAPDSPDTDPP